MPRLGHRGAENIKATDIYRPTRLCAQAFVKLLRILAGELGHAVNPQPTEITKHSGTDGNQLLETSLGGWHKLFPLTQKK